LVELSMARPKLCRRISSRPKFTSFRPERVGESIDEVMLTVDEYEAVRLKDLLNLEQNLAAIKMRISQPTFHRLLLSARKKITDAIVHGKALKIAGGNVDYGDEV